MRVPRRINYAGFTGANNSIIRSDSIESRERMRERAFMQVITDSFIYLKPHARSLIVPPNMLIQQYHFTPMTNKNV